MAKKKQNALDDLLSTLEAVLIQVIPSLASAGLNAILHKNKAKIKDAAVPVKPSTLVQPMTEKTQAQKNCEAAHTGQAGYCDAAGTWHPSNEPAP